MNGLSFLKIDQAEWYEKTWLWQFSRFFAWVEREDISSETSYDYSFFNIFSHRIYFKYYTNYINMTIIITTIRFTLIVTHNNQLFFLSTIY